MENTESSKQARTFQQIDEEYSRNALLAGDKQFKMQVMNGEIMGLHQNMMDLMKEKSSMPALEASPE